MTDHILLPASLPNFQLCDSLLQYLYLLNIFFLVASSRIIRFIWFCRIKNFVRVFAAEHIFSGNEGWVFSSCLMLIVSSLSVVAQAWKLSIVVINSSWQYKLSITVINSSYLRELSMIIIYDNHFGTSPLYLFIVLIVYSQKLNFKD